jgi:hypothetical protein
MSAIPSPHEQCTTSTFWCQALAQIAQHLLVKLGEGGALDLIEDIAMTDGWSPELAYIVLCILKPQAVIGEERAA